MLDVSMSRAIDSMMHARLFRYFDDDACFELLSQR